MAVHTVLAESNMTGSAWSTGSVSGTLTRSVRVAAMTPASTSGRASTECRTKCSSLASTSFTPSPEAGELVTLIDMNHVVEGNVDADPDEPPPPPKSRWKAAPPLTPQPRHQARQLEVSLDPPPPLDRIGERRGRPMQRHFHVPPCGGSAYLTGKAEPCLPDHMGRAQRVGQRWLQTQEVQREEIRKGVTQRPSAPSGALILKLTGSLANSFSPAATPLP